MRKECRTAEELTSVIDDAKRNGKTCNYRKANEKDGFEGWVVYIAV